MASSRKKKKAIESLPEDGDERWDIVSRTVFETMRDALETLGYEKPVVVVMLEHGERQAVMGSGFKEPGEGFAFIMDMATAYAEAVGIRMIATRAEGPIVEGQG